jgi:hypothetical protein
MMQWETWKINGGFIRPSVAEFTPIIIDMDTLRKCRAGLKKRITKAKGDKKVRLTLIKEEIDFLIDNL